MALTASEIRKKIRRQAEEERRAREEAVVEVASAASAAKKARSENDARLRSAFDAALKLPHGDARVAELQTLFDAALAGAEEVRDVELAVGRAVLSATRERRVTQAKLAEFTGLRVEDLRAWAELAMPADSSERVNRAGSAREVDAAPERQHPSSGFAVVVPTPSDGSSADGSTNSSEPGADQFAADE
ncbi:hypothetical protein [Amycolatopsis sp. WAC 01375]|uniref:hypothetical protein n=1 Tax=Amycolatopsis sp. WAC 01375 TaxID=2203194 RepID=UPI000F79FDB1|nr:hypothetical protein [Amycolatopsis sp. WAC 01375]